MIRLGIRVRAETLRSRSPAWSRCWRAGAEEVDARRRRVEFAVYGDALPSDEAVRALAGDVVLDLVRSPVDAGWASAWQAHLTPVTVGALHDPPAVARRLAWTTS